MPFVKDTSYRQMPSSEIPNGDFHQFLSLRQVLAKTTKHQQTGFQCLSLGILSSQGQAYALQDLKDSTVQIRVSVCYLQPALNLEKPITAMVVGMVHWEYDIGPVLFAQIVKDIAPAIAVRVLRTMEWIVTHHRIEQDMTDD